MYQVLLVIRQDFFPSNTTKKLWICLVRHRFLGLNGNNTNLMPHFFCYKTEFSSFQNNPNGSRSLRLFRNGEIHIIAKYHRTDLVILSHSREGKTKSYGQINMVIE